MQTVKKLSIQRKSMSNTNSCVFPTFIDDFFFSCVIKCHLCRSSECTSEDNGERKSLCHDCEIRFKVSIVPIWKLVIKHCKFRMIYVLICIKKARFVKNIINVKNA